jgi:hypothetical protein
MGMVGVGCPVAVRQCGDHLVPRCAGAGEPARERAAAGAGLPRDPAIWAHEGAQEDPVRTERLHHPGAQRLHDHVYCRLDMCAPNSRPRSIFSACKPDLLKSAGTAQSALRYRVALIFVALAPPGQRRMSHPPPSSGHSRRDTIARADCILGVTFFGDAAPDSFGAFDRAFITMFRVAAGEPWPWEQLPAKADDNTTNFGSVLFFFSYVVLINWTLLQVTVAVNRLSLPMSTGV